MRRKDSFVWMGLHVLIWTTYLLSMFLAPPPPDALRDIELAMVAGVLLILLVLHIKRRTRREREIAVQLAARDEFLRVHSTLGDRPPTTFFR